VRKSRFPSQQAHYIDSHQHRGTHNGNYRGGKITKACAICGVPYSVWPAQGRLRVTCAQDACYRTWQGLTTRARGTCRVVVPCAQCGRELRLFPSVVATYNYCNRMCQGQHHAALFSGVNNGRWQGGDDKYWMEQARRRDDYRCVVCGFDLVTDVHHIIPRSAGGSNDMANLLTLCPNHHRLADLGIISVDHLIRTDSSGLLGVAPHNTPFEDGANRQSSTAPPAVNRTDAVANR
jgi:hypothetical protein